MTATEIEERMGLKAGELTWAELDAWIEATIPRTTWDEHRKRIAVMPRYRHRTSTTKPQKFRSNNGQGTLQGL